MTDASGDLNLFVEVERKKKVADFRYSTTMIPSGSSFGSNGMTAFTMKGEKHRNGCDERFLEKLGAAPCSTIDMVDNAFMA